MSRWVIAVAFLIALGALGLLAFRDDASSNSRLTNLKSLEQLRAAFNQDQGKPRIVLLLSPT